MSVEITGAQLFSGACGVVVSCLVFFARQWFNRLQADLESAKKNHQKLVDDFHAYQLQSARDFAAKSDVNNGRMELVETMQELSRKVDRIFDKLDMKADKT